jgi:hypothetical protein
MNAKSSKIVKKNPALLRSTLATQFLGARMECVSKAIFSAEIEGLS